MLRLFQQAVSRWLARQCADAFGREQPGGGSQSGLQQPSPREDTGIGSRYSPCAVDPTSRHVEALRN